MARSKPSLRCTASAIEITQSGRADALTGLYNQVYCQRHHSPLPVPDVDMTLADIDIDHQTDQRHFWPPVGDQVLKEMGQRLKDVRADSAAIRGAAKRSFWSH